MSGHCTGVPRVVAQMLVDVCVLEARKISKPMAIAVVDAEGGLQLFTRMDGTLPVSTELAVSKAYTAAILRMTSAQVGELAQPGAPLYGIESTHNGRIVLFGGGLPLLVNGDVVGAIGVSGGSVEEDISIASPAAELLREMAQSSETFRELFAGSSVGATALEQVTEELWRGLDDHNPATSPREIRAMVGAVCLALSR